MTLFRYGRSIVHRNWEFYPVLNFLVILLGASLSLAATGTAASSHEQNVRTPGEKGIRDQISSKHDVQSGGDTRKGQKLFHKYCSTCHGPLGKGDGARILGSEVADLSSAETQRKLNMDLVKTIHEGRSGKAMPPWKWRLSKQQTEDVLAYLRTL